MSPPYSEWLPSEALTDDAVAAALAETVEQWGRRWFAGASPRIVNIQRPGLRVAIPAGDSQHIHGAHASATLDGSGKRRLLEDALGMALADAMPTIADHRLMDAFALLVLEDLVAAVNALARPALPADPAQPFGLTLGVATGEITTLSVCEPLLISLIKGKMRPAARGRDRLWTWSKALGPTIVRVEGVVGSATLAVEELEGLAIGDVLVLDRQTADPVALRLAGQAALLGEGQLARDHGRPAIRF